MAFFDLFPILFLLMFVTVFGIILYTVIQNVARARKDNASPVLDVEATVVAKRTAHGAGRNGGYTRYWVTFQFSSGDRSEFAVNGGEYGLLVEGDRGTLRFQGSRFLNFTRKFS